MSPELKELVELRMKKAQETLRDASILGGSGSYFGAVNRRSAGDYEDNKMFLKSEVDEYLLKCGTFIKGIRQALDKMFN